MKNWTLLYIERWFFDIILFLLLFGFHHLIPLSGLNGGLFCSSILCTTVWRMFHSMHTFCSWHSVIRHTHTHTPKLLTLLFQWNARKIKIYYETKCTSRSLCFVYLSFNQERNEKKNKQKQLKIEFRKRVIAHCLCLMPENNFRYRLI